MGAPKKPPMYLHIQTVGGAHRVGYNMKCQQCSIKMKIRWMCSLLYIMMLSMEMDCRRFGGKLCGGCK